MVGDGDSVVPGLVVLGGLAAAAYLLSTMTGVNVLVLAIGVGLVAGNVAGTPAWAESGVDLHKLSLETGIVLLGAQLSLGEVADAGPRVLGLVLLGVGTGLVVVELLGRRAFGLRGRVSTLLAAGSSICGVSAVVAVAGVVDADAEDVATVTATVLLFDAVTLVAFPAVASALGLPQRVFGVWAGISMFSTGPVTAAGFAYGDVAGQWATLTKLTRNALLGVVAVGYSVAYARGEAASPRAVWTRFPKFLVGFALVSAVASAGALSPAGRATLGTATTALFALAFVGLGLDIRLERVRETGLAPIGVVTCSLTLVSVLALLAVTTVL